MKSRPRQFSELRRVIPALDGKAKPDLSFFCSYSPALTTVEGLISRAISGLEQDQPTRRVSWGFLIAAAQGIISSVYLFTFPCG